jgi:hypothetical protein
MKKGLIILALLIPCLMMAQMSFGARGGIAKPKDIDMTWAAGLVFGYEVMPKLTVGVEGDYWSKSISSYTMKDIAIAAVGKYTLIDVPVKLCLGAGAGVHMIGDGSTENKFAAHGILEVGYPINPNLSLVGQFKYANIFEDPSFYVIYGSVGVVYSMAKSK